MKSKLLMFIATLVASAGSIGVQAQTDVTSLYLVNASFEDEGAKVTPASVTGWTLPTGMGNLNIEKTSVFVTGSSSTFGISSSSDGDYYFYNRKGWGNLVGTLSQVSKSMPAGTYYLCFDYKAADYSNNNNDTPNGSTLKLSVSQGGTTLATTAENKVAFSHKNNGSAPDGTATSYFTRTNWCKMGLFFTVSTEGTVTISVVESLKNSGRSDMLFDNFRLYSIGDEIQNFDLTGLVVNQNGDHITGWAREFTSAIGGLGTQENGSVTTATARFLEVWGKDSDAGVIPANGKLYQKITNLPNGRYQVDAACMSKHQGQNEDYAISGAYLYANTVTTPITENVATTKRVICTVVDGSLELGLKLDNATANWHMIDNVRLTYLNFDPAALKNQLQDMIDNAPTGKMSTIVAQELEAAIGAAEVEILNASSTKQSLNIAAEGLSTAIENANSSTSAYAALSTALANAETVAGEYDNAGSVILAGYIAQATMVYAAATTSTADVEALTTVLVIATKGMPTYRTLLTTGETFTENGKEYTITGTNLISNNGFEGGFANWYDGTWTGSTRNQTELISPAFEVVSTGGINNSSYLKGTKNEGYGGAGSIGTTWGVEAGKTYVFYYYMKNLVNANAATSEDDGKYLKTSWGATASNTDDGATFIISKANWDANNAWTRNLAVFTATENTTVNTCFRWLNSQFAFDEFFLAEVVESFISVDADNIMTISGNPSLSEINSQLTTNITAVNFENSTLAGELVVNNPNTILYNLPVGLTFTQGIDASDESVDAVLDENYPFNAPIGFGINSVSYERAEFTGISNESGDNGWQSIVLPFNVTSITSVDGNGTAIELKPFGINYDENTDDRPFWLYELVNGNYVAADGIEANVPYLISFPNDPSFNNVFNVSGPVTFSGAIVTATDFIPQLFADTYILNPNFNGPTPNNVYALDAAGSLWVNNSSVNSFFGYVTKPSGAFTAQYLPIFGETTGVKEISAKRMINQDVVIVVTDNGVTIESEKAGRIMIYTMDGKKVKSISLQEGSNFVALPAGEYVINGITAIVK